MIGRGTRLALMLGMIAVLVWAVRAWRRESRDAHGMTPLMQAAAHGDTAEIRRLVGKGANVNSRVPASNELWLLQMMREGPSRNPGATPLLFAVHGACLECARILLEHGADPNTRNDSGSSPLEEAVLRQRLDLVQLLVTMGASIEGSGAMNAAARQSDTTMLRFLLARGGKAGATSSDPASRASIPPLLDAVLIGNAETVRLLLEAGASPGVRNPQNHWTVARIARKRGLTEIESLLRQAGARDDDGADEGLLAGIQKGDSRAVLAALDAGANAQALDEYGEPLLCVAARNGDPIIVRALIEHRADLRARGLSQSAPLWLAISNHHPAAAAILIDAGADVNASDLPLDAAAAAGDLETCHRLLGHGALVNAGRSSALRAAVRNHQVETVRFLLDRGADARAVQEDGAGMLHAASNAPQEVVQLLIRHGAPLDGTQLNGLTPLMLAAAVGNVGNVTLLLEAGADRSTRDSDGRTAYDLAQNYPRVQALLRPRAAGVPAGVPR